MKQKLKKNKLLLFTLFGLLIAFISCSDNDLIKENHNQIENKNLKIRQLSTSESNTLKNEFTYSYKKYITKTRQSNANIGFIDFNNGIETIDLEGNKNNIFKIYNHPNDNENIFHNLVLSEKMVCSKHF